MRITARSIKFTAIMLLGLSQEVARCAETQDQLQQDFADKHYQVLLPKLNQAIAMKGPAAAGYDRYKLLMLKGETLLHIPPGKSAMDAFKAAVLVAPDADSAAIAKANALMVSRSSNGKFVPKKFGDPKATTLPVSIDIIDPDSRKLAFAALFSEMLTTAQPLVDRSEQMTTLPPIVQTAQSLGDLRPVEIAASGSDDKSKELLKKIGDHAQTLMSDANKKLDAQLKTIQTAAQKRWQVGGRRRGQVGLQPENADQVQTIADQSKQIAATAEQMDTIFGDAADFKTVKSDAEKTEKDADGLLKKHDYKPDQS